METVSPLFSPVVDPSDDLASARFIRATAIAAQRAGSIDAPLEILSESELDAPIEEQDADAWQKKRHAIRGYELGSELGVGGQATVYRGFHETTRRPVAIKIIPGGPFASSRRRARFDREAMLLAGFDHPNIVGIIDRGRTEDGSFFIVMELVEGLSLDEYWKTLDGDPEKLARLFAKIASAVEEAHQMGIVHRDLKPSNIRVDRRGEPHILDFGLARLDGPNSEDQRELTCSEHILGSLPWSSPEQAKRSEESVDARSDVYSLGVMLYQAIAGGFPYKVDGPLREQLENIETSIPVAPSRKRSKLTRGVYRNLDAIALTALTKLPANRYTSAGALAEELKNFLAGRPVKKLPRRNGISSKPFRHMVIVAMIGSVLGWTFAGGRRTEKAAVTADLPRRVSGIGLTLVRIPAGSFFIGSPETEPGRRSDEAIRKVTFAMPFWISTTEVTQQQFTSIMGFNPSDRKSLGPTLPVQCVTWDEANEFCRKLGKLGHGVVRLPTEAEWEYACRATESSPFGNHQALDLVGWWSGNSLKRLHPVSTRQPNFWGLYDMHGGVAEWCADSYQSEPASSSALIRPVDPASERVIRGGSYLNYSNACRAAARTKAPASSRLPDVGFRVVFGNSATSSTLP